ncbi:MAG: DUF2461 domain-containing protein [Cytophagaceae bacterium]|jgi:uncharacterized protein (TIGR02453 family)|nr:DUF2461 domain-containing protein [Cytophagaceae bacterium]
MENILPFLKKLRKNNNKEWFDKHKDQYLLAKSEMEDCVSKVLAYGFDEDLASLDPKKCLFRIYKDVRFSKDKLPYKVNMGASMTAGGKKTGKAGYYLHIEPGECFLGGGIYMPEPETLKKIRQEIDYNGQELTSILSKKSFQKYYEDIWREESLTRVPKGYDPEHPNAPLLKLKHFIVIHPFEESMILEKNFPAYVAKALKEAKPLNDFLNRAFE